MASKILLLLIIPVIVIPILFIMFNDNDIEPEIVNTELNIKDVTILKTLDKATLYVDLNNFGSNTINDIIITIHNITLSPVNGATLPIIGTGVTDFESNQDILFNGTLIKGDIQTKKQILQPNSNKSMSFELPGSSNIMVGDPYNVTITGNINGLPKSETMEIIILQ